MSDHFRKFSFAVALPTDAVNYAIELADATNAVAEELPLDEDLSPEIVAKAREIADFHERGPDSVFEAVDSAPDSVFEVADSALVIYAEEYGCLGAVADILQATLAKFEIPDPVVVEYADSSSRMRVGQFGGGAVIVTATEQHWMDTQSWAEGKVAELAAKKQAGADNLPV